MPGEWVQVATFGGGLNFNQRAPALADDEWAWCDGFYPEQQSAVPSPTYHVVLDQTFWQGRQEVVFGVLHNPFSITWPLLILTMDFAGGGSPPIPVKLYKARPQTEQATPAAYIEEIPWDGIGTRVSRDHNYHVAPSAAVLDGKLVLTTGPGDVGFSMLRWTGTGPYSVITNGKPTWRCAFLESFAGSMIGAGWDTSQAGIRMIRISDSNDPTVWEPSHANAADFTVLDDTTSGITGLGLIAANALGIFTRGAIYALAPTGNIPPFTRVYVGMGGALDAGGIADLFYTGVMPYTGVTPFGVAYAGYDDLYVGIGQAVGTKIWRYVVDSVGSGTPWRAARLLWHPRLSTLILAGVGRPQAEPSDFFYLQARSQGWGRAVQPLGEVIDHAIILTRAQWNVPLWRHVLADEASNILIESLPYDAPQVGAFVDTKDFAQPAHAEVDLVKVDWDALTPTARLGIRVLARDGLSDGDASAIPGKFGFQQDLSPLFLTVPAMQQGELAAGESELPVRARGKYVRFRLEQREGAIRIRGLAFRRQVVSDRAANPEPGAGTGMVSVTPGPAGWDVSDYEIGKWG